MNRRQSPCSGFSSVSGASPPLLRADKKYSELHRTAQTCRTSFDFVPTWLRKSSTPSRGINLMRVAETIETSLRANPSRFDNLIIRPHLPSSTRRRPIDKPRCPCSGHSLQNPSYLSVTAARTLVNLILDTQSAGHFSLPRRSRVGGLRRRRAHHPQRFPCTSVAGYADSALRAAGEASGIDD